MGSGRSLEEIRALFEKMMEEQKDQTTIFKEQLKILKDIRDSIRKD